MKFTKGNTIVNLDKLWFLQRAYVERAVQRHLEGERQRRSFAIQTIVRDVINELLNFLKDPNNAHYKPLPQVKNLLDTPTSNPALNAYVEAIIVHDARNYTTAPAFLVRNRFFFVDSTRIEPPDPSSEKDPQTISDLPPWASADHLGQIAPGSLAEAFAVLHLMARSLFSTLERLQQDDASAWRDHRAIERATKHIAKNADLFVRTRGREELPLIFSDLNAMEAAGDRMPSLKDPAEKARYGLFCKYLRWTLLYGSQGPSIAVTVALLGRENCERRLVESEKWMDAMRSTLQPHEVSAATD